MMILVNLHSCGIVAYNVHAFLFLRTHPTPEGLTNNCTAYIFLQCTLISSYKPYGIMSNKSRKVYSIRNTDTETGLVYNC